LMDALRAPLPPGVLGADDADELLYGDDWDEDDDDDGAWREPGLYAPAAVTTSGGGAGAAGGGVGSGDRSEGAALAREAVAIIRSSTAGGGGGLSGGGGGGSGGTNKQPVSHRVAVAQPREHLLDRYRDRINLDSLDAAATSAPRHTGRDDRATVEQVLDPRTRLILFKMLNQNFIAAIHGCVSTGKEANVYHAVRPDGSELAMKIYKTSILVFKDRDRYVSGEYRFASGYSKGNPRKMVKMWAEKETRNLKRLATAGIPCPNPLALRLHVLAMEFVGRDGIAAPRLKDAPLSQDQATLAYLQVQIPGVGVGE